MADAVAIRYAKALAELVARPGSGVTPEDAIAQVSEFAALYRQSGELRTILLSPAVPSARKRALIRRITESAGFAPLVRNFLFLVTDHRRLNLLATMREAFEAQLDEQMGLVRVDVLAAQPLTETQKERLKSGLSALTGRRVRAGFSVAHELLGGAVARIGSVTYDGSVRGQLEALRRRMEAE